MSKLCRSICLGVSLAGAAGFAAAQSSQEEGASSADSIEEVLVTAQKRSERLLDVPLSMSALTKSLLEDASVAQVQDVVMLTPGLEISESFGRQTTSPAIRGVAPFGFLDPTVLVYVDGFTLGFTRTENNAMLFDLERIEVLKGPQATLYGRNALGGVINYITAKPGNELQGDIKAEYGSYDSVDVAASISGPLVRDRLMAKIGIGYREFGGFLDNEFDGEKDVNDERDFVARSTIRFVPNDQLEIGLTLNYSEANDACGDCAHVPSNFGNNLDPNSYLAIGRGEVDFNDFDRTINQDFLGGFDREEVTTVLDVQYEGDWGTLTSITGFGESDSSIRADITRLPGPSVLGIGFKVPINNKGWSEELRLASRSDARLKWLAGVYAFQSDRASEVIFDGLITVTDDLIEISNYAGFVNLDYQLTDSFSIGGGLRYDWEENQYHSFLAGEVRERSAGEWLPKLVASYKPTPDLHLYGTISRGYHAGGTNSLTATSPEYEPEFIWNYELGLKGQLAGGAVRYDVAAFYMDWKDQQIERLPPGGVSGTGTFIVNAAASEVYGIEASVAASVSEALTLMVGVSLQDATSKEFLDNTNAPAFGIDQDLSGNDLIMAPKVTASASAQYAQPIGAGDWRMRLRADGRYTDDRAFDSTNLLIADAFFVANVYAGIENEKFEIGVFADNLFDEKYLVGGFVSASFFPPLLTMGDPRMVGVRLRARF